MKTSESITNISPALLAVQRVGLTAIAGAKNSQTNSKYAKLPEVIATVVPEFAMNDLVLLQPLGGCRSDGGKTFRQITTRILHKSGEWMEETAEFEIPAPPKSRQGADILNASQTDGLVITYGRRYALLSFLGIATGDDQDAQNLTSKMPDGAPEVRYDQVAPWHSLTGGYWQHQDAPVPEWFIEPFLPFFMAILNLCEGYRNRCPQGSPELKRIEEMEEYVRKSEDIIFRTVE